MSDEMNSNLDPQTEKLTRFTPDASALNRDELMFAAGRASVPRGRFWHYLVGILAVTQAITLTLLLTDRPEPPSPRPSQPTVAVPLPTPEVEPPTPSPPEVNSLIAQHRRLRDDLETGYRPISSGMIMTDSKVILTARSNLNWD